LREEPDAAMLAGMALLEREEQRRAREILEHALAMAHEGVQRNRITQLLAQVNEDEQAVPRGRLVLDGAFGIDTNAFAVGQGVERGFANVEAEAGYKWLTLGRFSSRVAAAFHWEDMINVPELRYTKAVAALPLAYESPGWLLEAAPRIGYQALETDPFLLSPGAAFHVRFRTGRNDFGAAYTWEWNNPLDPHFSQLHGPVQTRSIYYAHNGDKAEFSLGLVDIANRIGDLTPYPTAVVPLSNDARGPRVWLEWNPYPDWSFEGRLSYLFINYLNTAEPNDVQRFDHQLEIVVQLAYKVAPKFKTYLRFWDVANESTMGTHSATGGDKNYDQFIAMGGITYEAF
jgi:hypothetical protein